MYIHGGEENCAYSVARGVDDTKEAFGLGGEIGQEAQVVFVLGMGNDFIVLWGCNLKLHLYWYNTFT